MYISFRLIRKLFLYMMICMLGSFMIHVAIRHRDYLEKTNKQTSDILFLKGKGLI